jgi:O-antigen/teichoic acid export membrane protein
MFFSFLNTLFAFSLVAMDQQSKLIITNAAGVIFNIVTNIIFIPKYGFIGAAVTTVISEIIILAGTYFYVRKNITLKLPLLKTSLTLLAASIMGLCVYLLQPITYKYIENLNILILIPIGATIYALLIYLFKVVTNDDIKKILTKS